MKCGDNKWLIGLLTLFIGIMVFVFCSRFFYRAQGHVYLITGEVRHVDGSWEGAEWGVASSGLFPERVRMRNIPESLKKEGLRVQCTYVWSGVVDDFTGWEAIGIVGKEADCQAVR